MVNLYFPCRPTGHLPASISSAVCGNETLSFQGPLSLIHGEERHKGEKSYRTGRGVGGSCDYSRVIVEGTVYKHLDLFFRRVFSFGELSTAG